jgi:hypothetical protein
MIGRSLNGPLKKVDRLPQWQSAAFSVFGFPAHSTTCRLSSIMPQPFEYWSILTAGIFCARERMIGCFSEQL